MSEELRPCPFCGEMPEVADDGVCRCNNKSCSMAPYWYLPKYWNIRPIEDDLRKRIAELEEKQRWIPVSERLPDNWESVLTIDISKSTRDMVTAFYNPETSLWSTHFSCDLWVTHWMPLPEPPIVYGKVCEK